jgi:predicted nucleic acid-binding protein
MVIDSSVWIDYFNTVISPETDLLRQQIEQCGDIIVSDIIIHEVLRGFKNDKDFNEALQLLNNMIYRRFYGKSNMVKAAQNYRFLRKRGFTIRKPNDILIGTFCIENSYTLLHNDHDFDPMEKHLGLRVVHHLTRGELSVSC